jgi:Helix-hairpin-helix motif
MRTNGAQTSRLRYQLACRARPVHGHHLPCSQLALQVARQQWPSGPPVYTTGLVRQSNRPYTPTEAVGSALGELVNTGAMVPSGPTQTRLGFGTILWALVPLLSFGLLAPIPFAHAAVRLRQRRMWAVTAAYAIGSLLWIVAASLPEADWSDTLFVIVALMLPAVGTTHAFLLRRRVFTPSPPQPALAAALAAKQRRAEARAIASRDAALARQLRIGRPDLPRQFDDGGLVDVNHVPAQVLVDQLGLSPAHAGQVVEVRDRLGGFAGPEELTAYTDLSPAAVDGLKEHLVFFAVE